MGHVVSFFFPKLMTSAHSVSFFASGENCSEIDRETENLHKLMLPYIFPGAGSLKW